jgi:hypothetical protein
MSQIKNELALVQAQELINVSPSFTSHPVTSSVKSYIPENKREVFCQMYL